MDLSQYLTGIGRRWKVIVASLVVAVAVGWLLSPQQTAPVSHAPSYQATTYLLSTASGFSVRGGSGLETVAALVTLGEVPRRVADAIDYQGDPATLAGSIQADADSTTQLLKLTATAPTAARAELLADTFAKQLLAFLSDRADAQVQSLRHEVDRLDQRIARLNDQLPPPRSTDTQGTHAPQASPSPDTSLDASDVQSQVDALTSQRQGVQQQLTSLTTQTGGNLSGYEVIEPASVATPVADAGIQAPRSRTIRLAIAAAIGLFLGIALALLLERLDTRLRAKPAAEDAYGLPVLAVIPKVRRGRRGTVLTETAPRGPAANAFRLLAAALQFGWQDGSGPQRSAAGPESPPRTVLVTSGEPREGRSTVVANLAATFAEVGKRVVVVCCDYRHPTLQATFGVGLEPGLTDLLEGDTVLGSALQDTAIERVRLIATGAVPARAGELFGSDRARELLEHLRAIADVIVIDTSPVLAASDWTQLIPWVDAVLVVARSGKTDAGSARRTAELLGLLKAPVVGATLNDVSPGIIRQASDRSWYRYQAPDRGRAIAPRTNGAGPVVVVADVNGDAAHDNGGPSNPNEGIPHLARPGSKE